MSSGEVPGLGTGGGMGIEAGSKRSGRPSGTGPVRHGVSVAVLAGVLALAAACTGTKSSAAGPANPDSESTATVTSTDAGSSTTDTTAAPNQKARPKIAYPSGGLSDTVVPPGDEAYHLVATGDCAGLLQLVQGWPRNGVDADGNPVNGVDDQVVFLYKSAAEACLGQWVDAVADFGRLPKSFKPQASGDACTPMAETVLYKWVKMLVDARHADSGFSPEFVTGSASLHCPGTTATSDASTSSTSSAAPINP